MFKRKQITITYLIQSEDGSTREVIKKTGFNKRNILWHIQRYIDKKYGKGKAKAKQYRIKEIEND